MGASLSLCYNRCHARHQVGVGLERRLHVHHAILFDHGTDGGDNRLVGLGSILLIKINKYNTFSA